MNRSFSFRARGFSLIEVMLAILILALGLLGLGAVIPVIVKQQRTATDATLGVSVAKAAKSYLLSRPEFDQSTTANTAWDNWLLDGNWSNGPTNGYLWRLRSADLVLDTGVMDIANPLVTGSNVQVRMEDRLWPSESAQPMQDLAWNSDPYRPQFVWDFICRRIFTKGGPSQLQVAIFVRRVDSNIKRPQVPGPGSTQQFAPLLDTLLGRNGVQPNDRCIPVAVDTFGIPTNRGNNGPGNRIYSTIVELDATFDPARRDHIYLDSRSASGSNLLALASAPGQKLVDNFGNVYTVRGADDELVLPAGIAVIVDPPVPNSVGNPANITTLNQRFRQVIFTPQIPGAVSVFTVTRPVK